MPMRKWIKIQKMLYEYLIMNYKILLQLTKDSELIQYDIIAAGMDDAISKALDLLNSKYSDISDPIYACTVYEVLSKIQLNVIKVENKYSTNTKYHTESIYDNSEINKKYANLLL